MARKARIEFEGALYHVIQRAGSRRAVFGTAEAAQAFEACLFEACARAGWRLHAYAFLRDGFHLAIETPRANLVSGMRWLLSTFALRRRRLALERGRRFERRYRAILVEPGPALAAVASFIHLSPVRAGIVSSEFLPRFRWSSCRRRLPEDCPAFLVSGDWLHPGGARAGNAEDWSRYHEYLARLASDETEQNRLAFSQLGRGWAVGSTVWRGAIARRHPAGTAAGAEARKSEWGRALEALLEDAGRTRADVAAEPKSAGWKIAIARRLRHTTSATNGWIARELKMGAASSVSVYLTRRSARTA